MQVLIFLRSLFPVDRCWMDVSKVNALDRVHLIGWWKKKRIGRSIYGRRYYRSRDRCCAQHRTFMTMGTASTMAWMAEALGLTLPGAAAIPAVDARKKVMAQLSGRRIVEMVKKTWNYRRCWQGRQFENSIIVNAAIGGSTNFVIHLLAIAGRIGVELTLEDFDRIGSKIPLLVNLKPSGKYLMEDFYYAGGLPVVLNELKNHLHQRSHYGKWKIDRW